MSKTITIPGRRPGHCHARSDATDKKISGSAVLFGFVDRAYSTPLCSARSRTWLSYTPPDKPCRPSHIQSKRQVPAGRRRSPRARLHRPASAEHSDAGMRGHLEAFIQCAATSSSAILNNPVQSRHDEFGALSKAGRIQIKKSPSGHIPGTARSAGDPVCSRRHSRRSPLCGHSQEKPAPHQSPPVRKELSAGASCTAGDDRTKPRAAQPCSGSRPRRQQQAHNQQQKRFFPVFIPTASRMFQ